MSSVNLPELKRKYTNSKLIEEATWKAEKEEALLKDMEDTKQSHKLKKEESLALVQERQQTQQAHPFFACPGGLPHSPEMRKKLLTFYKKGEKQFFDDMSTEQIALWNEEMYSGLFGFISLGTYMGLRRISRKSNPPLEYPEHISKTYHLFRKFFLRPAGLAFTFWVGAIVGNHWAGLIVAKKLERLESGNLTILKYEDRN